jgi:SecD/SecF fusion protein
MKPFLGRIIICLLPVVVAAGVVYHATTRYLAGEGGFRLGVDLVGGTILVYEVDKTKQMQEVKPDELAASLKRRIDPADLYNVTIRPVPGETPRVEIILPTGGRQQTSIQEKTWKDFIAKVKEKYVAPSDDPEEEKKREHQREALDKLSPGNVRALAAALLDYNRDAKPEEIRDFIDLNYKVSRDKRSLGAEEVEAIKNLISQQGRLEFRILANITDDEPAIAAAEEAIRNPANARDLEAQALAGLPPGGLGGQLDGGALFPVKIDGEPEHSYSWVELGKEELYSLHLNSAAKDYAPTSDTEKARAEAAAIRARWAEVAKARDEKRAFRWNWGPSTILIYSRVIPNPEQRLGPNDRDKKYEYFVLTRDPERGKEITGDFLTSARQGYSSDNKLAVDFRFNSEGSQLFGELTSRNKPPSKEGGFKRQLAIVLDGSVRSAPSLNAVITSSGQIYGEFTQAEVNQLVQILRAGALPATLKQNPVAENTMGATLGEDTIKSGTQSVALAFLAVLLFMIVYYRFAGIVACIALLANLLLTVAFMVVVNATFTLPGLAGLVLMIGMAVDANVLIYERLREERERGASLALAIRNGYDRAFPTIIDTHLSSIFTAIVLYVVGNDQLKGFGISLTVGLIISLFTSLYMTRTMFDLWLAKGWLRKLTMMQLFHRPNINFMAIRYYWFTATIILTILGAGLFLYRGTSGLNIDFVGGTAYTGVLNDKVDIEHLREMLLKPKDEKADEDPLPDLSIEQLFVSDPDMSSGNQSKLFTVRTSNKEADKVLEEVNRRLGPALKKIELKDYKIRVETREAKDAKEAKDRTFVATLSFADPQTGKPDYASPAQVSRLLTREFDQIDVKTFRLEPAPKTEEKDRRYTELQLSVNDPLLSESKFEGVLKRTQTAFQNRPQPERLENFDKQLAANTQERALYAILASWGAILLYLWFRFGNWTFGAAAVLCLIHDLFFTLGVIAGCHYVHGTWLGNLLGLGDFKLDLPSVAALLTLVGYSVNDTIVVFDRIREVRGKNPQLTAQMINDSVNQTLSRTVLASLATWLVVIVLYIWGGEGVHLFAWVMVVGVIVGTYSSIYIASPLLLIFGEGATASTRERAPQPTGVEA